MNNTTQSTKTNFNKLHVEEVIRFAIGNVPNTDEKTLYKFLDLINADRTHAMQSPEQVMAKVRLVLKYIPGACAHSLMILLDLLEIPLSAPTPALNAPNGNLIMEAPIAKQSHSINIFDIVS